MAGGVLGGGATGPFAASDSPAGRGMFRACSELPAIPSRMPLLVLSVTGERWRVWSVKIERRAMVSRAGREEARWKIAYVGFCLYLSIINTYTREMAGTVTMIQWVQLTSKGEQIGLLRKITEKSITKRRREGERRGGGWVGARRLKKEI